MRLTGSIALSLLAAVAGCGAGDDDTAGSGASVPETTGQVAPTAKRATVVEVVSHPSDIFAWTKKTYRTKAGRTEFRVSVRANGPAAPHNVAVERSEKCCERAGHKWIGTSPTVAPGERSKLAVDLRPGRYWLYCSIRGHWQGGMVARLIVS